jgi:3-methyladenine DNA glycosylase AlkD
MAYAATVLERLTTALEAERDPAAAGPMRAYMRDQFDYVGVRLPRLRVLAKAAAAGLPTPGAGDLTELARACWARPEREYQYAGIELLRRNAKALPAGFLPVARGLIEAKSWWDTVDVLAAHVVGGLLRRHPELVAEMDAWIDDENLWIARTALLHQLTYKQATDAERLFRYCTRQAGHRDFFIRKAIGWALREYAWTDPAAVAAFVARTELSGLSRREALKHLGG